MAGRNSRVAKLADAIGQGLLSPALARKLQDAESELAALAEPASVVTVDEVLAQLPKAVEMYRRSLPRPQINAETQEGVVQLAGFADSATSQNRAGELAHSVDGVVSVKNDLEIRQN